MNARIAVVTGVSKGIGEALATRLIERGFEVLGIGRSAPTGLASARFSFVRADLRDAKGLPALVDPLFDAVAARQPTFAVLVNNAADAAPIGAFGTLSPEHIAGAIAVNLTAPLVLANAFLRALHGTHARVRVINVSSGAAARALPGAGVYCVAKAGLEMLAPVIAAEAGGGRAEAVTIRPGIVDTPMQAFMRSQDRERLPEVGLFEAFHANGRLAPPEEVASRIVARLIDAPVDRGRTYSIDEL